jgi:predicted PurR-regulated permease PerM
MKKSDYNRIGSIVILVIVIILTALILKPFIGPIIISMLITFITYPVYQFVNRYVKSKSLASLIMLIGIITVILIPLLLMINYAISEVPGFYMSLSSQIREIPLERYEESMLRHFAIKLDISQIIAGLSGKVFSLLQNFVVVLPGKLLNLAITFLLMFYLYIDGPLLAGKVIDVLPYKDSDRSFIVERVKGVTRAVLYGQFVTAFVQGIIATIGFVLIGIHPPVLLGFIMFIFCLLPYFGAATVYTPISLFLLLEGLSSNHLLSIIKAIVLMVYGLFVISTVDNFLKPYIVGSQVNVHPGLMILGILGGLFFFGVIGIVIGPLTIVLFLTLMKVHQKE